MNKTKIISFLYKRKYEILLLALIQHLFIGIFLTDLEFYTKYIWVINMLIVGISSTGVFVEKGKNKNRIRNLLLAIVIALPLCLPFLGKFHYFMTFVNISYMLFFAFIFFEIIKFLIRPGYINVDVISASVCGYLLLLDLSVFLMQFFFYNNPKSFKGVDLTNNATVYMDLVYFCSITLTSIGFGDIVPNDHHTKLMTSLLGIFGQFYSVILVGILISKFSSQTDKK